jgi:hypothetical protein
MLGHSRLLVLLALFALFGCAECVGNEAAIARALALTPQQRAKLMSQMQSLAGSHRTDIRRFTRGVDIPMGFEALYPREIVIDPIMPRVYLSGCFDDNVLIVLRDLGPDETGHTVPAELALLKGERGGETVLWTQRK